MSHPEILEHRISLGPGVGSGVGPVAVDGGLPGVQRNPGDLDGADEQGAVGDGENAVDTDEHPPAAVFDSGEASRSVGVLDCAEAVDARGGEVPGGVFSVHGDHLGEDAR